MPASSRRRSGSQITSTSGPTAPARSTRRKGSSSRASVRTPRQAVGRKQRSRRRCLRPDPGGCRQAGWPPSLARRHSGRLLPACCSPSQQYRPAHLLRFPSTTADSSSATRQGPRCLPEVPGNARICTTIPALCRTWLQTGRNSHAQHTARPVPSAPRYLARASHARLTFICPPCAPPTHPPLRPLPSLHRVSWPLAAVPPLLRTLTLRPCRPPD